MGPDVDPHVGVDVADAVAVLRIVWLRDPGPCLDLGVVVSLILCPPRFGVLTGKVPAYKAGLLRVWISGRLGRDGRVEPELPRLEVFIVPLDLGVQTVVVDLLFVIGGFAGELSAGAKSFFQLPVTGLGIVGFNI